MKCPKCGYLGFERGDRCRNCGYDFSLASSPSEELDVVLDPGPEHLTPPLDLDRVIGAPEPEALGDLPLFGAFQSEAALRAVAARRAAGLATTADDMPLINAPSRPRAPLGVRRATGEVPRARPSTTKRPVLEDDTLFEPAPVPVAVVGPALHPKASATTSDLPASPVRRITAALVDDIHRPSFTLTAGPVASRDSPKRVPALGLQRCQSDFRNCARSRFSSPVKPSEKCAL